MHQISFPVFAQQQQAEREADFLDCAPSATQAVEVQAVAAPASLGSRVRSLRERRIEAVCDAAINRWVARGCVGSGNRWVVVAHTEAGPSVFRFPGRPAAALVIEGQLVESLHRVQAAV